jgi:uncharacterized protein YjbI with pentapeptide repeats
MSAKRSERAVPRVGDGLSTEPVELEDEVEIESSVIAGDYSGIDATLVQIDVCRISRALLIGTELNRVRITDCIVEASDLSGLVLGDSDLARVEFHDCRMSGLQAHGSRLRDVAFFRCKLDEANFRMTVFERAEFHDCDLVESDFYGAKLPGAEIVGCDLTGAELSNCDMAGTRLLGSTLDRLKGAGSLRGVSISGDQIVPVAMSVFGAMDITVVYDD